MANEWTAQWTAEKLVTNPHVARITAIPNNRLRVERNNLPTITIATTSNAALDLDAVADLINDDPRPDFLVNLSRDQAPTWEAVQFANGRRVPIGRLGELTNAMALPDVRAYVDQETGFRERGIAQHSRVSSFDRTEVDRYTIHRVQLPPITCIFIADYEVNAETVRRARQRYGSANLLVAVNPNRQITDSARTTASELGYELLNWTEFLSRLRR
jgi:hypothetical protein